MASARFRKAFLLQYLRHIPSVHKHVYHRSSVYVLAVRHDADRSFFEELLQPLSGFWSARFVQFRCVDPAESDAVRSHPEGIAIDCVNRLAGWNSSSSNPAKAGGPGAFLVWRDCISAFWKSMGPAIAGVVLAMGLQS